MPNSRSTLNTTAVWHISSTRSCATKSAARNCMRMTANAAVTYVLPSHNTPPPLPQCLYSQYYEALEPLPPLPQPPLWRSPPTSPTKPGGSSTRKKTEVEAHKQAISRHRAQWQRGPTPPGYWDIGFPDTQRVAALNAEADRMHARKRALVEEEAEYVVPFAHQLSKVRRLTRFTGGVEGIRSGSRNGLALPDTNYTSWSVCQWLYALRFMLSICYDFGRPQCACIELYVTNNLYQWMYMYSTKERGRANHTRPRDRPLSERVQEEDGLRAGPCPQESCCTAQRRVGSG